MEDKKILYRNQLKILEKVTKGYGFTQEELDNIYGKYDKKEYDSFETFLLREGCSERERLLGDIYHATEIKNLERVDTFLDKKIDLEDADEDLIKILTILGIIENKGD